MLKRIPLVACIVLLCAGGLRAQDVAGEAKRRDIRRLLQLTKAGEAGLQTIELMLPEMRALYGALLNSLAEEKRRRAIQIMEEELFRVFTPERMVEEVIPIYDKYLTAEEIKELIVFYESPAGRKFVSVLPQVIKEAAAVGEKLAEKGVKRIQDRMREEGITGQEPSKVRPRPDRPKS